MCDFEHEGKCGWTEKSEDGVYMWQRQQRGNTLPDSGPSSDYTTGTSTGYPSVMFIKPFPNPVIHLLVLIQTEIKLKTLFRAAPTYCVFK